MFQFLLQCLGSGAGRGRPVRANVRRFTPRLEALEERANPSGGAGVLGGEWLTARVPVTADIGAAAHAHPDGGKPGISGGDGASIHPDGGKLGISGGAGSSGGTNGQVTPFGGVPGRVVTGSAAVRVSPFGGTPGGVVGRGGADSLPAHASGLGGHAGTAGANGSIEPTISRSSGEEIPQQ